MEASLLKGVGYDLLGGSNHVYLALFICETQRVPSTLTSQLCSGPRTCSWGISPVRPPAPPSRVPVSSLPPPPSALHRPFQRLCLHRGLALPQKPCLFTGESITEQLPQIILKCILRIQESFGFQLRTKVWLFFPRVMQSVAWTAEDSSRVLTRNLSITAKTVFPNKVLFWLTLLSLISVSVWLQCLPRMSSHCHTRFTPEGKKPISYFQYLEGQPPEWWEYISVASKPRHRWCSVAHTSQLVSQVLISSLGLRVIVTYKVFTWRLSGFLPLVSKASQWLPLTDSKVHTPSHVTEGLQDLSSFFSLHDHRYKLVATTPPPHLRTCLLVSAQV